MSSSGWAESVLVLTVLAPLLAVTVPLVVALPNDHGRWVTAGFAVSAAAALVLLGAGEHPHVSKLAPDDVALAAMAATALVAAGQRAVRQTAALAAAATAVMAGIAGGVAGRPSTVAPLLGIVAATAVLALSREAGRVLPVMIGVSAVVAGAGLHAGNRAGAAGVVLGVAAMGTVAAMVPRRTVAVVVPAALVLGLRVAPVIAGSATSRWVGVVLGTGAGAVLLVRVVLPARAPALCAAAVPWVLLAAVEPVAGTGGSARVLAAAVIVALVAGGPLALLAALPGGAVLTYAIADAGGWPRAVFAALLLATVVGLLQAQPSVPTGKARVIDGVVLGLGAWVVVRPSAWTWARVSDVTAYDEAALLAVAAGLITTVGLMARGAPFDTAPLVSWFVGGDQDDARGSTASVIPTFLATVATGLVAALLLRSARL